MSSQYLHLDSVTTNYGKMSVKYKASKLWNQLSSSLKEFFSAKYFSNKLKELLQAFDIDSTFNVWLWSCFFVLLYRRVCSPLEKFRLIISVCLSFCLSLVILCRVYLLVFVPIWATSLDAPFAFLVVRHCALYYFVLFNLCSVAQLGE